MFGKPIDPIRALMGSEATKEEFEIYLDAIMPRLQMDPLSPHPLDRLRFSFLLLNVSRAFQQQLTRHRIDFSYSIQSLRMVNVGEFARNGSYTLPEKPVGDMVGSEPGELDPTVVFASLMQSVENTYNTLVDAGWRTENARGILPLSIHSHISFSATFRAIHAMLKQRLCFSTQDEFRVIALGIRDRIGEWNHALGSILLSHCEPHRTCKMNRPDCRKVKHGLCELPEPEW
jgi:flavin-dependent thymidylate synthase